MTLRKSIKVRSGHPHRTHRSVKNRRKFNQKEMISPKLKLRLKKLGFTYLGSNIFRDKDGGVYEKNLV